MQHISELSDKSASTILASTLQEDSYHMAIQAAASELVAAGMSHYWYQSSCGNGYTIWSDIGSRNPSVAVNQYGRIIP